MCHSLMNEIYLHKQNELHIADETEKKTRTLVRSKAVRDF